jgi:hypothetical protein
MPVAPGAPGALAVPAVPVGQVGGGGVDLPGTAPAAGPVGIGSAPHTGSGVLAAAPSDDRAALAAASGDQHRTPPADQAPASTGATGSGSAHRGASGQDVLAVIALTALAVGSSRLLAAARGRVELPLRFREIPVSPA